MLDISTLPMVYNPTSFQDPENLPWINCLDGLCLEDLCLRDGRSVDASDFCCEHRALDVRFVGGRGWWLYVVVKVVVAPLVR